jgi:hypothetical protein
MVLAVLAASTASSAIHADDGTITGLFSTGLTNSNTFLAEGSVDSHWTIASSPIPGNPTQLFVAVTDGYPIPTYWFPNGAGGANAQWLMPTSGSENIHPEGDYVYQTTFTYSGPDPDSAFIRLRGAADDIVTDIRLNGHSLGAIAGSYSVQSGDFLIQDFFQSGLNILEFHVTNIPPSGLNPTGIFVEFRDFGTVPEPGTMALVGGAAGAIFLFRRRRTT